jgi:hypothetical protein
MLLLNKYYHVKTGGNEGSSNVGNAREMEEEKRVFITEF